MSVENEGNGKGNGVWPRVLVVDDEVQQAQLTSWLIKDIWPWAEVATAKDGDQAIRKATTEKWDLVLADVRIPGPSGIDVCRFIKETPSLSKIKVVTMTGFSTPGTREQAMLFGADDFLPKPFDLERLRRTLVRVLGRPAQELPGSTAEDLIQ